MSDLTYERLVDMADRGLTPAQISTTVGVSLSVVYKRIRRYMLKDRFSQYVVRCRDVCPALIRIMAFTGANLHVVHRVAYPDISYARLQRFVTRESLAHYFETEPFIEIQWVESQPPLYPIERIAQLVIDHDSAKELYLNGGPCWKTISNRLGVNSWADAKKKAQRILST